MDEKDVRAIIKEMIKDNMLIIINEIKELVQLNIKCSALLLSGMSSIENFSVSRRSVIELLETIKNKTSIIEKSIEGGSNKDDSNN